MKNGWSIIAPQTVTNMVLNPSGETTGNFATVGGSTVTRSTTYQKYGLYSYRVQTAANNQGVELTLSTLTNSIHYVTVRVKGKTPEQWGFSLSASPYIPAVFLENLGEGWSLYGLDFGANVANGKTFLRIGQLGPGNGDFYLDGIQVEAGGTWTTYCDGTQDGCAWNGPDNAASSTRSSESRAGGLVKDFYEDYGFFVDKIIGAGSTTQNLSVDEYALLPGGELNSIKIDPRQFTIIGKFIGTSEKDLHDKRQDLLKLLSDESYPANQPIKIRFAGASVPKEIDVFYQSGLEGELNAFYCEFAPNEDNQWERLNQWVEKCAIQFQAPDPFWYEVGESAALLDTNDSATFRIVAGRLKSTGQWSELGPPNVAGTYLNVNAIAEDATYIYIGGDFSNWDNIANADYIVRYNKQTGVYSALGTGMDNAVNALVVAPDSTLYAGGGFTTAGGSAANRIAKWNGIAWSALGTGMNGTVSALVIGPDGTLYAGGAFTTAGGGAANRIAKWNGAAWSALGTGMNAATSALTIGWDGSLYAGGSFTTAGGTTVNYVAKWNGTAWSVLGAGMDNIVNALAIGLNGTLYAAGSFTTAGGVSASRVANWNGTAWSALGLGLDSGGFVQSLSVGADGILYVGGFFASAGGITLSDRVARWNGSAWSQLDLNLPGTPSVIAILSSKFSDPVVPQKYDLFIGFDTTGTGYLGGKVTTSNGGTAPAFPKAIFTRSGGTSATISTLKNERNGNELLFNYSLLDGETLVVNLKSTQKSITSSFFRSRLDAVLPNCNFGDWQLLPGNNDVTSFVDVAGAPTVTGYMLWKDKYKSWD